MNKKETRREFLKKSAGITAGFAIGVGYGCTGGGDQCGAGYGCAGDGPGPLSLPRYDTSKIKYLGRFDVTGAATPIDGYVGEEIQANHHNGFRYQNQGSGGIAYNPNNDSLFLCGSSLNNDVQNTVIAEITIETPKLSGPYNEATIIQDFEMTCGVRDKQIEVSAPDYGNGTVITGLLVTPDDKLIISAAGQYLGSGPYAYSLFSRASLDISNTTVQGPYGITSINNRIVGNGMGCNLPENWQATFGGYKAIAGGGNYISTMNSANYGPGFHFFDPDDLTGASGRKPGGHGCYYVGIDAAVNASSDTWDYSYNNAEYWGLEGNLPTYHDWNAVSCHRGSVVLPESRTFMAFGSGGSDAFYDTRGEITGGYQGPKATPPMFDRFWLYDARDLKKAFDGTVSPINNVWPYATFDMDFSELNDSVTWCDPVTAAKMSTFDWVNRKLYICENQAETIHVLSFGV